MLLYSVETVPFESPRKREIHFYRHGNEFGAANEFDYERMADAFMSAPSRSDIPECIRRNPTNDLVRLNPRTRHFGVCYGVLVVKTYYVPPASKIRRRGGAAGFVAFECAKTK